MKGVVLFENKKHKRLFALLQVLALVVGVIPSALADNEPDISVAESIKEALVDFQLEAEPIISLPIQSIIESDEAAEEPEDSESTMEYEAPTSMDGETLTRTDNGGIMLLGGGGTMENVWKYWRATITKVVSLAPGSNIH